MLQHRISKIHVKVFMLLALLMSVFPMFPLRALAADDAELAFHVKPVLSEHQVDETENYFDINASPGTNENIGLELQNDTDKEITVVIKPHTAFTNVNGVVEYSKDAKEKDSTLKYSMEDLIKIPEKVTLQPKEEKTVTGEIQLPKAAFDGLLAGGLEIKQEKPKTKEKSKGQGFAVNNEFSYTLGVVASNNRSSIKPELDLVDVFADQLNYRNVFSATIQNKTPSYVNKLEVNADVQNEKGESLYKVHQEGMQMAPNSHFDFPIPLNGDSFKDGTYVLKMTAKSGKEQWSWEKKFTVDQQTARKYNQSDVTIDHSTNWWMIAAVALLILVGGLLLFMILKRRKK